MLDGDVEATGVVVEVLECGGGGEEEPGQERGELRLVAGLEGGFVAVGVVAAAA